MRVELSDAIMMIEGGATGLEGLVLSGSDGERYEASFSGLGDFSSDGMARRIRDLGNVVKKRKYAIVKAKAERKDHQMRLAQLEANIRRLVDALEGAKSRGDAMKQSEYEQEIIRLGSVRDLVAARALRFAKTEALGATLLTNAKTQRNLLIAAKTAADRGNEDSSKILVGAFNAMAAQSADLKDLRKAQIAKWSAQTSAERVELGRTLLQRSRLMLDQLNVQLRSAKTPAEAASVQAKIHAHNALRIKVGAKIEKEKREFEAKKNVLALDQQTTAGASAAMKTVEKSAAVSGMYDEDVAGLEWSIPGLSTITSGLKTAAGAVASAGKAVGTAVKSASTSVAGAVKKGVSAAYNAAKTIIKKGACLLGSNPQIAGAIAAAPSPQAQAVGAGLALATGILKSACPGGKVATEDMIVDESGNLSPADGGLKKYIVPGAIVVGAGFLFLRASKR